MVRSEAGVGVEPTRSGFKAPTPSEGPAVRGRSHEPRPPGSGCRTGQAPGLVVHPTDLHSSRSLAVAARSVRLRLTSTAAAPWRSRLVRFRSGWIAGYDPAPRHSQCRMRATTPYPPSVAGRAGEYPREESNLTFDLRRVACRRHTPRTSHVASAPARIRTWTCSFGGSRDGSVSLPGRHQWPGRESHPHARWARPSEGRVSSVPPPGRLSLELEQWTVEGVEPSSAGCKPAVFPLDDTPVVGRHRSPAVWMAGLEPACSGIRNRRTRRSPTSRSRPHQRKRPGVLRPPARGHLPGLAWGHSRGGRTARTNHRPGHSSAAA